MDTQSSKTLRESLFVKEGISAGCPFCKALNYIDLPIIGSKIRILTDSMAGLIGEVIGNETALPTWDSSIQVDEFPTNRIVSICPGEIIVHEDGSKYHSFLNIRDHLLEPEPFLPVPSWAPPISFYWAAKFHNYIMEACNDSFHDGKWKFNGFALIIPITYILKHRLPIDSFDFFAILGAHGLPLKWKKRLVILYENCKEVVRIYHFMNSGRNYTHHKKVTPFSVE